jgi:YebC/PmpR family DNA-binding regulatory protein
MAKFKLFAGRKGKADQAKNNQFVKIAREIHAAVRAGGPSPDANFALRTAIANGRAIQMPMDSIERAIKKASGADAASVQYEEIMYEGYGPGGVAILVRCLTDNRNRTAADVRAVFNKRGGNMGESGCVSYMFDQKGVITVSRETCPDEDEMLMHSLESGADELLTGEDEYEVLTSPSEFEQVKTALEQAGIKTGSASVRWIPQNYVHVSGENAKTLMKMMESFDDYDDVQDIYANFEMDELTEE